MLGRLLGWFKRWHVLIIAIILVVFHCLCKQPGCSGCASSTARLIKQPRPARLLMQPSSAKGRTLSFACTKVSPSSFACCSCHCLSTTKYSHISEPSGRAAQGGSCAICSKKYRGDMKELHCSKSRRSNTHCSRVGEGTSTLPMPLMPPPRPAPKLPPPRLEKFWRSLMSKSLLGAASSSSSSSTHLSQSTCDARTTMSLSALKLPDT